MNTSEAQLDNPTHAISNDKTTYGITIDTDLPCELNIADKCEVDLAKRDRTDDMSISIVINVKQSNSLVIELGSRETLENILDTFDCHIRSAVNEEVILDCAFFSDEKKVIVLCSILHLASDNDHVIAMKEADFLIFHA